MSIAIHTLYHPSCDKLTLGPLVSPPEPSAVMPNDAFHRAKLSSPASSLAYSSVDFTAPGLYPTAPQGKNEYNASSNKEAATGTQPGV